MTALACGLVALLWGAFCGVWAWEASKVRERRRWYDAIRQHMAELAGDGGPLLVPLEPKDEGPTLFVG